LTAGLGKPSLVVSPLRRVMPYQLRTPWQNETWCDSTYFNMYARLAGRPLAGGTYTGGIPSFMTDVARGVTLLVNGTVVTESRTPYQDDLANATTYYLGGHEYTLTDAEAQVLINAGYSEYLTPVV
jgi:hypothetical protein